MSRVTGNTEDEVLKYVRGILGWNDLVVNKGSQNIHYLREFLRDIRVSPNERHRLLEEAVTNVVDNHEINGVKEKRIWLDAEWNRIPEQSQYRHQMIYDLVHDLEEALSKSLNQKAV
ncbi:hypothetical protein [Gluconobacter albidus]|uniref:hypothetical protein n=1 Tax=Gluconobacter albidus TaxID=318683 RepID=UPI0012E932EF|nr:hypothetical protein [Gluconobacter albidus]